MPVPTPAPPGPPSPNDILNPPFIVCTSYAYLDYIVPFITILVFAYALFFLHSLNKKVQVKGDPKLILSNTLRKTEAVPRSLR